MNEILWAFNFNGLFKSACVAEVDEESKTAFVELKRSEKKVFVVFVKQSIVDFMIAKPRKSGISQ
jgi:hypothetical protein